MKKIIVSLLLLVFMAPPCFAQKRRVHVTAKTPYNRIKGSYISLERHTLTHFGMVNGLADPIIDRAKSLAPTAAIFNLRGDVRTFVDITSRTFFRTKYPILPVVPTGYNQDFFKNLSIQNRYRKKITLELENLNYYLGTKRAGTTKSLFLTEADRLTLTLDALDEVIRLTLQNEDY